jgi:hypothetical protein
VCRADRSRVANETPFGQSVVGAEFKRRGRDHAAAIKVWKEFQENWADFPDDERLPSKAVNETSRGAFRLVPLFVASRIARSRPV